MEGIEAAEEHHKMEQTASISTGDGEYEKYHHQRRQIQLSEAAKKLHFQTELKLQVKQTFST
ncbi:MAG: hypothetical protein ACLTK0_08500 [Anaerovoracaceae bacterium]